MKSCPSCFQIKKIEAVKSEYEKQIQELYAEIGRLTTQLSWLKKNLVSDLTRAKRAALVKWDNPDISIRNLDITYIHPQKGWMYLVAIMDWYSRYVVSWELDQTLELPFVIEAVEKALARTKPEIMNSDQGSQFTSPQYKAPKRSRCPHQHGREKQGH
ncbi:transposase InsO family protein [Desulfohalotomaculum tongense]|nr:transposase InsO family protein [Desulforadius tongensis]